SVAQDLCCVRLLNPDKIAKLGSRFFQRAQNAVGLILPETGGFEHNDPCRIVLVMIFVGCEHLPDELVGIIFGHIGMTAAAFGLRPLPLENEPAPALIEHLRRAGKKLLAPCLAVKADPDIASGKLAFPWLAAPWDAAAAFKIECGEEVPAPVCLVLYLAVLAFLDFPGDCRLLVDHILPHDLDRKIQAHRSGFEHPPEIRGI